MKGWQGVIWGFLPLSYEQGEFLTKTELTFFFHWWHFKKKELIWMLVLFHANKLWLCKSIQFWNSALRVSTLWDPASPWPQNYLRYCSILRCSSESLQRYLAAVGLTKPGDWNTFLLKANVLHSQPCTSHSCNHRPCILFRNYDLVF